MHKGIWRTAPSPRGQSNLLEEEGKSNKETGCLSLKIRINPTRDNLIELFFFFFGTRDAKLFSSFFFYIYIYIYFYIFIKYELYILERKEGLNC